MNERIKELRDHARTLVSEEERANGELYEAREQWERCDEIFAELIIRECAEVASDYDGAHYVGTAIENHFGIEE